MKKGAASLSGGQLGVFKSRGESVLKVGIAGYGAIGKVIGEALDRGIKDLEFVGICVRDVERGYTRMSSLRTPVPVLSSEKLAKISDVVVECVPKEGFNSIALPALKENKILVTVSAAGIIANPETVNLAEAGNGRIILATGALLGLDAVRAAAEGEIFEVVMITKKPPNALIGAPYLKKNDISVEGLNEPKLVFSGSAAEGAEGFPANVNVAAALGLAGIGPDRTKLEIWADPSLDRNTHSIRVTADSASFEMSIENVQSEEKPGTGKITALSVIACLRGLVSSLKVGT